MVQIRGVHGRHLTKQWYSSHYPEGEALKAKEEVMKHEGTASSMTIVCHSAL